MITGKELFGEIKKKKSTFLCSLGEVFFSETSLGALWDHDTNDESYMCAYPVELSRNLMLCPISNSSLLSHDSLGCYWLGFFFFSCSGVGFNISSRRLLQQLGSKSVPEEHILSVKCNTVLVCSRLWL